MAKKLFDRSELIALLFVAFLTLILGRWGVFPLVVMFAAIVGLGTEPKQGSLQNAAITGAIGSFILVVVALFHNFVIGPLPGQNIPPFLVSPAIFGIYLGAVVLGTITAVLIVFLRAHPNERVRRYGLLGLLLVFAVAFPFFEQSTQLFWANAIIIAMMYTLQALGLNIVAGYAGMLDLGYVAFFAIGGYTMALLNSPHLDLHLSFWLVIWVAAAAAALFGLILGTPVLPLRGDYLAIVTLGFGEIVPIVFKNLESVRIFDPITEMIGALTNQPNLALCLVGCGETPFNLTNGTQGITTIDPPQMPGVVFVTGQYIPWYFLILVLLAVSVFFIARLRSSRIGRAWVALREDELAANSMGIDLVRAKLTAFMIGAMFSGFAGAFYASYVTFVSPDAFDFSISVIVLCMVILGGTGSITGVMLGGFIIKLSDLLLLDKLQKVLSSVLQVTLFQGIQSQAMTNFLASLLDATQYKLLLFGLILVLMMQFRPQGLVPSNTGKR